MTHNDELTAKAGELRQQAEATARIRENLTPEILAALTPDEIQTMFHELQVHQIELEMQNDELLKMQAKLEDSRARYFDLYDLAPVGYFTIDEKGLIMEANLKACSQLGVERRNVVGQPLSRFIFDDDVDSYYLHRKKLFETEEKQAFELRMLRQGAAPFWARWTTSTAQDTGGSPVYRTVMEDITTRKQVEGELLTKNAELESFTYTVSHDLKSPLVTIETFLGYLSRDIALADQKQIAQDIEFIHNAAAKMNTLIDNLLDLSRIGRVVNPFVEAPFQHIAQQALDLVAGRLGSDIKVVITQTPIMLYCDQTRIVEVFQNLLENAVKFTGKQSSPLIEIGAQTTASSIVCYVRDNGMGIDPRHQHKIFGLFERLHGEIEGTGIGLAMVKRIVEVHGGILWAESEGPDKGSCFWFTLPMKNSES